MKRRITDPGSMDMLLDTMCNTFGGVCFIALMVAVISASIPKVGHDMAQRQVSEDQVAAKESARLLNRRDMLKSAIEIHSSFVDNAATGVVLKADLLKTTSDVAANEEQIRRYEKKRIEYLDELAKLKTRTAYSRREASRLARLLRELEEKVGRPLFDRHRVVRTPRERELQGRKMIDVWLHQRRLYMMNDNRNIKNTETGVEDGKHKWDCQLIKGHGVLLNDDFFLHGKIWPKLQRQFDEMTYVRVFVDTVSFDELCLFRDALISRNSMYNWIVNEEDVIHFIEGYDGHVQ